MDIAKGEAVEAELNRPMEKRTAWEIDAFERDESWKASVAAYNARRREENRLAWCEYHKGQARRHRAVLEALIEHHVKHAEMYRP